MSDDTPRSSAAAAPSVIRSSSTSLQMITSKPRHERTWQEAIYLLLQGQGSIWARLISAVIILLILANTMSFILNSDPDITYVIIASPFAGVNGMRTHVNCADDIDA